MTADVAVRTGVHPVEDRGDGPPVLWLSSAFAEAPWLPVHDRLLAHGHRLVVPHAPSVQPGGVLEDVRAMADYVLHLVDVLDALGLDRLPVVGTSFGGWVAAELAARHPERVAGLALVDAMGLRVEGQPAAELFALNLAGLAALLLHDRRAVDVAALPAFDRQADPMTSVARMIVGQEAMARLGWSPYLHDPGLPGRLPRWSRPERPPEREAPPALVVWGDDDRVLPEGHAHAWCDLLGAPLEVVTGAGHLPAVEQPDRVAALLAPFLTAVP